MTPLITNVEFITRADDTHARNVKAGWWSDLKTGESILQTRNRAELMMLVVSEVSEADHGIQNSLNDDKLPHLPMFDVELADVAIRLFDMIGAEASAHGGHPADYDFEAKVLEFNAVVAFETVDRGLLLIINEVSAAMEHLRKGRTEQYRLKLMDAQAMTFAVALGRDIDLLAVIDEKLAFNANRADHKIENRKKDDGKKF